MAGFDIRYSLGVGSHSEMVSMQALDKSRSRTKMLQ